MTASQLQRHVGKSEQVCHDLFSGVMLCAVEYMYLIFVKVMQCCVAIVTQIKLAVVVVIQFHLPCNNHCKWKFLTLHKILSFSK